ncbi:MAG: hypothetical protein A2287_05880 [Candidatus Melainabacteria bacterium RIFOXYA12_FULL_32_12]|nr:MAG: hypothetical protein A2104_04445 [Candidatus Melainabacteria bacterium GWF2_32_7]OGI30878.1 MAG: hypothetical protein A2287_05880 [Candidatus Melainabacteria bacterium RIFOXYA12_FULL_32_12]
MDEQRQEEMQNGKEAQIEEMRKKMEEMQEKITHGIDRTVCMTAEGLDKAAEKMQQTASFFRSKTTDSLKEDLSNAAKKYPGKTLAGAVFFGFILGRILSR